MARGWESKSVEEQQAEASTAQKKAPVRLSPVELTKRRQRDHLLLSRQNVMQQLSAARNPRHSEQLRKALADLDTRIAQLR